MQKLFVLCLGLALFACKPDQIEQNSDDDVLRTYLNMPNPPHDYTLSDLPDYLKTSLFQNIDNTPLHNPVTNEGAFLGRVLFYDKQLSRNNTISCASCHQQEHAFSDPNRFSEGWLGQQTSRHSMGLINSKYYANGHFFWDERAATLEEQVLLPIQDSIEMGMTLPEVVERMKTLPYYPILFKRAFGAEEVTTDKMAMALAQFVRSMVSYQTKFDRGRAQVQNDVVDFPNFTEQENLGKFLFGENQFRCASCHGTEGFISSFPTSNGLDPAINDEGVGGITGDQNLMGTFKAPSLKGILLRAPYMHDGRFATIDDVLDHYSSGIQNHPNLDLLLTDFNGNPVQFNMTSFEKDALKAFFATLTDFVLLSDEKYSNPFK